MPLNASDESGSIDRARLKSASASLKFPRSTCSLARNTTAAASVGLSSNAVRQLASALGGQILQSEHHREIVVHLGRPRHQHQRLSELCLGRNGLPKVAQYAPQAQQHGREVRLDLQGPLVARGCRVGLSLVRQDVAQIGMSNGKLGFELGGPAVTGPPPRPAAQGPARRCPGCCTPRRSGERWASARRWAVRASSSRPAVRKALPKLLCASASSGKCLAAPSKACRGIFASSPKRQPKIFQAQPRSRISVNEFTCAGLQLGIPSGIDQGEQAIDFFGRGYTRRRIDAFSRHAHCPSAIGPE